MGCSRRELGPLELAKARPFLILSLVSLALYLPASSLLLVGEAHLAKTDAVLLASTVAAQGALGRMYVTRGAAGLGAAGLDIRPRAVETIRGFNYSKGRWVTLTLYSAGGGT